MVLLCLVRGCRPVQVAAFLSPMHPAWDLSLAFVMGGALLVALPGALSSHVSMHACCAQPRQHVAALDRGGVHA
jgi:hypothetical protein